MESPASRTEAREIIKKDCEKTPAPRNLLVVDDETLIRWSLNERLSEAGYAVTEAADAANALRVIDAEEPSIDVALLDYKLPDGDGVSLLKTLRVRHPDCRVILMTAFGSPEMTEDAFNGGAFAVINKPFQLDEVSRLVKQALTAH